VVSWYTHAAIDSLGGVVVEYSILVRDRRHVSVFSFAGVSKCVFVRVSIVCWCMLMCGLVLVVVLVFV
jgi:hypothetical protein